MRRNIRKSSSLVLWADYDAKVFGKDVPEEVAAWVNQGRAYSSPIWYTP